LSVDTRRLAVGFDNRQIAVGPGRAGIYDEHNVCRDVTPAVAACLPVVDAAGQLGLSNGNSVHLLTTAGGATLYRPADTTNPVVQLYYEPGGQSWLGPNYVVAPTTSGGIVGWQNLGAGATPTALNTTYPCDFRSDA